MARVSTTSVLKYWGLRLTWISKINLFKCWIFEDFVLFFEEQDSLSEWAAAQSGWAWNRGVKMSESCPHSSDVCGPQRQNKTSNNIWQVYDINRINSGYRMQTSKLPELCCWHTKHLSYQDDHLISSYLPHMLYMACSSFCQESNEKKGALAPRELWRAFAEILCTVKGAFRSAF